MQRFCSLKLSVGLVELESFSPEHQLFALLQLLLEHPVVESEALLNQRVLGKDH